MARPAAPQPRDHSSWRRAAAAVLLAMAAAALTATVVVLFAGRREDPESESVRTLQATTSAVRVASLTGRMVQRLAASATANEMSTTVPELERIASESDRLRGSASQGSGVDEQRLDGALARNIEAARALRSVALAPTSTSGSDIALARTAYRRSLDGLETVTRSVRSELAASGSLSSENREALDVVANDLADARDRSSHQFDVLSQQVLEVGGSG